MNVSEVAGSLEWWHVVVSLLVLVGGPVLGTLKFAHAQLEKLAVRIFDRLDHNERRLEDQVRTLNLTHVQIVDRIARIEGQLSARDIRDRIRNHFEDERHDV